MNWKSHPKSLILGAIGALVLAALMAARNGSGTYSLPAGNPVSSGSVISSTVHNNTMADVRDALTQSVSKDGQTVLTGSLNFGHNSAINTLSVCDSTSCGSSELIGSTGTTVRLGNGATWTALSSLLPATFSSGSLVGDTPFQVKSAGGTAYLQVHGDGSQQGYGVTSASLVDVSHDQGTFTGTFSGAFSTTATLNYVRSGQQVTIYTKAPITDSGGGSGVLAFGGIPTALRPAYAAATTGYPLVDGGVSTNQSNGEIAAVTIATNGTATISRMAVNGSHVTGGSGFSATATTKGLATGFSFTYAMP